MKSQKETSAPSNGKKRRHPKHMVWVGRSYDNVTAGTAYRLIGVQRRNYSGEVVRVVYEFIGNDGESNNGLAMISVRKYRSLYNKLKFILPELTYCKHTKVRS